MCWRALAGAIRLEVAGSTSMMKLSAGFTRALPSVLRSVFYGLSFTLMTIAVNSIDMSIAYAMGAGWARRRMPSSAAAGSSRG